MIRYTLRQLSYFVACADTGSVAAAAEALNVSQPSVSASLAKLEDQLGVQLLLRHHAQGVSPTPTGARLLAEARGLLKHGLELQELAASAGRDVSGELRLGSFVTLAPAYLPSLISSFSDTYPGATISLGEGTQESLLANLRSGRHEAALLYDVDLPGDIRTITLAEIQPYVLLPADHPFARLKTISVHALAGEKMILLDVAPSRTYFLSIMREHGIEPEIGFASPSLELVRGMVGRGLGFSLLVTRPETDVTYEGQKLAARPLQEHVEPGRICLAMLKQLRPTRLMNEFEAFCLDFFQKPAQSR